MARDICDNSRAIPSDAVRSSKSRVRVGKRLCHNCATKPVFTAKTDLIDDERLLILGNLLKTKMEPKIPAYRPVPQYLWSCEQS